MERQLEKSFEYKYINDELKKTILEDDLKDIEEYKEKVFSGTYPLIGKGSADRYIIKIFNVSGNLIPENLYTFLEKLPEDKQKTLTYDKLKEMGLDLISPTTEEIIRELGNESSLIFDRLTQYFSKQKHVELERKKDNDVADRLIDLYNSKELNCPELLEIIKAIKLGDMMKCKSDKELKFFTAFLNSLSTKEKEYLIPRNIKELKKIECDLNVFGCFGSMQVMRSITGFVNLTLETIDGLSKYLENKKCLEICSGTGLLAHLLQENGINVIPTDIATSNDNKYEVLRTENFTNVIQMDGLKAIKKFDTDVLIMAWPPYQNPIAANALKVFFNKNPNGEIIYVGEWEDGCTADDRFFELIQKNDIICNFLDIEYESLPGIHDAFYILTK